MDVIILTGMSGAGKSQAAGYLEDQGYFCIDNVPPQVLPDLIALFNRGEGDMAGIDKVAFVVDIRSRELIKGFGQAMKRIDEETPVPYRIVFLEAGDNVLVNRYRQTRRKHPLTDEMSLTEAIATERRMLNGLRGRLRQALRRNSDASLKIRVQRGCRSLYSHLVLCTGSLPTATTRWMSDSFRILSG